MGLRILVIEGLLAAPDLSQNQIGNHIYFFLPLATLFAVLSLIFGLWAGSSAPFALLFAPRFPMIDPPAALRFCPRFDRLFFPLAPSFVSLLVPLAAPQGTSLRDWKISPSASVSGPLVTQKFASPSVCL